MVYVMYIAVKFRCVYRTDFVGALISEGNSSFLSLSRLVCADNNHVRTWTVTRFRGMISTQPGSTPLASFKILSLEETESHGSSSGNDIGEGFTWGTRRYHVGSAEALTVVET